MIHHIIILEFFVVETNIQSYFYILHEASILLLLVYIVCIIQSSCSQPMNIIVFF